MLERSGTLEFIGASLARLFAPLTERLSEGQVRLLFSELGLEFPPELETKSAFMSAVEATAQTAGLIPGALLALADAVQAEDVGAIISRGLELFELIKNILISIEDMADELNSLSASLPGMVAAEVTDFANNLPTRLLDYLVVRNLEAVPALAEVMEFIGTVEREEIVATGFEFTRRQLNLDEFFQFLQSPTQRLRDLYDWGAPGFNGQILLALLERFLVSNNLPALLLDTTSGKVLDAFFGEISVKTDITPPGLLIRIIEPITLNNAAPVTGDDWKLEFAFNGRLVPDVEIVIQPDGNITFKPPAGELEGGASVTWTGGQPDGEPYILLGEPAASRIEVRQFIAKAGVDFAWDSLAAQAAGAYHILGEIKNGKLAIDFSQGDGFLTKILSNVKLESDFDLGFGFSTQEGLFFIGSAALEIQIPFHLNLGVVDINALTFSVGFQGLEFPIGISADIKASLGPLVAVVKQIGMTADLSLPSNRRGNLGVVN
ncbi:MAG: hypothetical protein JW726_09990, partial [Anaerolineales bacterium]|nr:hypothetical protein [Anaerolineales bacterium]